MTDFTDFIPSSMPETPPEAYPGLHWALRRLAELQREAIDPVALQDAVATLPAALAPKALVEHLLRHLGADPATLLAAPDPAQLPLLVCSPDTGWGVLVARDAQGRWVVLQQDPAEQRGLEQAHARLDGWLLARARLRPAFKASKSPVLAMVLGEMARHRSLLGEAAVGGLLIGVLGLVSSFYSMQIYDRVIPSNAMQTLLVLSLGVAMTIVLEWLARAARSRLYERLIDAVDARLARAVYLRLLAVRLDQLPPSVGSLAAQTRGYETVRGFLTQMTGSLLVDLPFALIFLALLGLMGGPLMMVPLLFFVLAVGLAVSASGRLDESAKAGAAAGFFKTGLLVETVEGAETLKSGQGGWRMLGRWLSVTGRARDAEQSGRRVSEHFQHAMQAFQQLSYAALIALGAWRVGQGEMSMGALVACSILSGRVLSPVSMLVGQMLQWSHTRAALQALDRLWEMEDDHAGQEPVLLERLSGHYRFEQVRFSYAQRSALELPALQIRAGEKIGVVGPIGSGKTTLLRLLSGLYKPQDGRVLLDDVDLALLSKPVLAEHMGYLQQEGRLFAGSLRDNLLLGLVDPGDAAVLDAARRSGLLASVIAPHPQGLQQPIHEGGSGLSGGQRQLVNFTRVLLRRPSIWLLDEPTASLDGQTERQLVQLLAEVVQPGHTLVLVTHKPELLRLVDRLIVVADQKVLLDGPVEQVLARLQTPADAVPRRVA